MKSILKYNVWLLHDKEVYEGDIVQGYSDSLFTILEIKEDTIKFTLKEFAEAGNCTCLVQHKDTLQYMRKHEISS